MRQCKGSKFGFRYLMPVVVSLLLLGFVTACGSSSTVNDEERAERDLSEVSGDDVDRRRATRVEDLLVGQVSGVRVQETARGIRVIIRGPTSVHGSNEPLYVIDGMPVEAAPGRALIGLNPRDIKSIRVLKDPVDTSMYGMRGANGVVIIKTKLDSPPGNQDEEEEDERDDE